ncbi:MAG: N-acetylglucosaminyl-diphospho-decaprenol L-rhamnosyltransferase [Verrucomicrobiales bacterium]
MDASVIYVVFGNQTLDASWIPADAKIIIVHNDGSLDTSTIDHPNIQHIFPRANLGFGRAINVAMKQVDTERVILCNPDTRLDPEHWAFLSEGACKEIRTLRLSDAHGVEAPVVFPHYTPYTFLATALRLGRLAPLGSRRRALIAKTSTSPTSSDDGSVESHTAETHWVSGAVLSLDVARFRYIDGFSPQFFLYFEDADLCQRLGAAFDTSIIQTAEASAIHYVGGSADTASGRDIATTERLRSAALFARAKSGWRWGIVSAITRLRWAVRARSIGLEPAR